MWRGGRKEGEKGQRELVGQVWGSGWGGKSRNKQKEKQQHATKVEGGRGHSRHGAEKRQEVRRGEGKVMGEGRRQ